MPPRPPPLHGRQGLILGLGQSHGPAWQVARAAHAQGARLVLSCVDRPSQRAMGPLAARLGLPLLVCNPAQPGDLQALLGQALDHWGAAGQGPDLDFVVHSTAWAPLGALGGPHGQAPGSGNAQAADAFLRALHLACHSFAELAHRCAPHMPDGGTLVSLSQPDADDAWRHPGLMAPVAEALTSTVRYLAHALADQQIQVHALAASAAWRAQGGSGLAQEVDTCLALLTQGRRRPTVAAPAGGLPLPTGPVPRVRTPTTTA